MCQVPDDGAGRGRGRTTAENVRPLNAGVQFSARPTSEPASPALKVRSRLPGSSNSLVCTTVIYLRSTPSRMAVSGCKNQALRGEHFGYGGCDVGLFHPQCQRPKWWWATGVPTLGFLTLRGIPSSVHSTPNGPDLRAPLQTATPHLKSSTLDPVTYSFSSSSQIQPHQPNLV